MGDAPDKIWAKPSIDGWLHGVCSDVLFDTDGAEYILSTPVREQADELVEALGDCEVLLTKLKGYCSEWYADEEAGITRARALLAKIKEASNG